MIYKKIKKTYKNIKCYLQHKSYILQKKLKCYIQNLSNKTKNINLKKNIKNKNIYLEMAIGCKIVVIGWYNRCDPIGVGSPMLSI